MHITVAAIATPEPRRGRLLCPACQSAHIEPISLSCSSLGGQRGTARIDADGVSLDPTAPAAESGSAIAITWRCHEGHVFAIRLRSIHGTTTAETAIVPFAIASQDPERN